MDACWSEATQIICLSEALTGQAVQAALSDQAAPGGSASQLQHRPAPQLHDDSANQLHGYSANELQNGPRLQAASAFEHSKASTDPPAHVASEATSIAAIVSSAPVASSPGLIHDAVIFQDPEGTLT